MASSASMDDPRHYRNVMNQKRTPVSPTRAVFAAKSRPCTTNTDHHAWSEARVIVLRGCKKAGLGGRDGSFGAYQGVIMVLYVFVAPGIVH